MTAFSGKASLKEQARELLSGVLGVRGVGFGWDSRGNRVLNVDLDPRSDKGLVERRLNSLDTHVNVRSVSGTISAGGPRRH
jgi:hypothetical protein